MSRENVRTARAVLSAWNRGDSAALLAVLDPEVEVHRPTFVESEVVRGPEAVERVITEFRATLGDIHVEVEELIDLDDKLISLARLSGRSQSGMKFDAPVGDVFTLREGKIVRWEVYPSHEEARRSVGLPPAG